MASMPDPSWNKNAQKSAAISTMTEQQHEEEFCEVPQSQLPDRILSFMENNDLPVFIDKKKCNTIKFRTSRPEFNIQQQDSSSSAQLQPPLQAQKRWNFVHSGGAESTTTRH